MDSAIQRRQKNRVASNNSAMTDSDKINLQLVLDTKCFGEEIRSIVGVDPSTLVSFKKVLDDLTEVSN